MRLNKEKKSKNVDDSKLRKTYRQDRKQDRQDSRGRKESTLEGALDTSRSFNPDVRIDYEGGRRRAKAIVKDETRDYKNELNAMAKRGGKGEFMGSKGDLRYKQNPSDVSDSIMRDIIKTMKKSRNLK